MSLLPNLDQMTDNEKMAVLESIQKSIAQSKEIQKKKIGENVDLVVQALKKIESDIRDRFDSVGNSIEKRVLSIQDGRDGINGKDGRDGKDGRNGKDGLKGDKGDVGQDGRDGVDGIDGVSVVNANIDFDGSLIITLSDGREINVGEVVSADIAEKIKVINTMSTNAAIAVKDEGTTLTNGVKSLNFVGSGVTATTSGDDVTVTVTGGSGTGTVTSVAATVPTFLSVTGSPITTSGTLAISLSGTALPVTNGGTGITSFGTGVATFLGTPSSANLAAAVTDETGTGALVFATSPTLVTPILGTPTSGTLTNATGLPISTGVSGLGTGVATALAVNVGTAGAPVVNGGALGTPSGGTVTNLTGTASININGTVGATTTNTGAFTTLTASADSTFSSTGALTISKGNTAARPSPVSGMLRFNTQTVEFEGYNGTAWAAVGGGATISNDTSTATDVFPLFASATSGSASSLFTGNANLLYKPSTGELKARVPVASNGIVVNSQTVATSYTIAAGFSAMSAGPITLSGGAVVTLSSGSRWVVQ